VAVNPDLRLKLAVCSSTDRELVSMYVLFDLLGGAGGGGGGVKRVTWPPGRPLVQAGKDPRSPSWHSEYGIAWPSGYQGMEIRPNELELVANLPSLNAETWDGRCSLVYVPEATSITFGRRKYSHMTTAVHLSKVANRARATVSLIVMAAHRVSLFHVCHGERA
jgi:hypothetical protein